MCSACQEPSTVVVLDTNDGSARQMCETCATTWDDATDGLELIDIGAYAIAQEFNIDPLHVYEKMVGSEGTTYAEIAATLAAI